MTKKFNLIRRKIAFAITAILLLPIVIPPVSAYALGVGDKAPGFHVTTLQGKEISFDRDFKGKKPVYLFFWTTW